MTDSRLEHQIHSLTRALNQTTSAQGLGKPSVTGILLIQDIVRRDAGREAARAYYFQPTGVLTHEYRTAQPIIAMGNRVEQGLTDRGFVESQNVVPEQTLLIALSIIAEIDALPERIMKKEESFPELGAILRGAGCFRRAVLEDDFRLRQIPVERLSCSEQDQRCIVQALIHEQLGVGQKLGIVPFQDTRACGLPGPAATVFRKRFCRQIGYRRCAGLGCVVTAPLCKYGSQFVWRNLHHIIPGPAQVTPFVLPRRSRQSTWNMHQQKALTFMLRFFNTYAMAQPLIKPGFSAARLCERRCSNDLTRTAIRYAKHDFSTTLIGKCNAVIHQFFEVEIAGCRFEFEPFAFRLGQQTGYLVRCRHV